MFRSRILSQAICRRHLQLQNISHNTRPCISNVTNINSNRRYSSAATVDDSYVKKFMKAVGWMDHDRTKLKLTGYFLYESIPDKVKYMEWFERLELPDTFTSWFVVTELHCWMLMVRYMAEDMAVSSSEKKKYVKGDGHFVRNCIIEALWADVGIKIKLLEGANPAIARKQVAELSEQFQAALVAYDEGLDDDRILAAAVWRRLFSLSPDTKAEHVEAVVKLIRHQLSLLDKIPGEDLKFNPDIKWLRV